MAEPRMQIVLRVAAPVNKAVRAAAKKAGLSINAFCEGVLARAANAPAAAPAAPAKAKGKAKAA